MSKNKPSNKYDKENVKQQDSLSAESLRLEEPDIHRSIELTIDCIENFSCFRKTAAGEDVGTQVLIEMQHSGVAIGESPSLKLDNGRGTDLIEIKHTILFTIAINKQSSLAGVVSTPILITVLESTTHSRVDITSADTARDFGSKNKGKRSSTLKLKSVKSSQGSVLGMCTFDLIPLLLGEKCVTEKLLLEIPSQEVGEAITLWRNIPSVTISAKLVDMDIFRPDMPVNFLTITVESIYNLPSVLTNDMDYKASTVVYTASEVPEDVVFTGGVKTSDPEVDKMKCWQTLMHLEGRAKFSKYKLHDDVTKNELSNEINLKASQDQPRVQWNCMHRSLMLHSACEVMLKNIKRYKYWPFFFSASGKGNDDGKQKAKGSDTLLLYQCYADVSQLLYPGTTRCRLVVPLHTFSTSAMAEHTGLDKSVFDQEIPKEPIKEKEMKKGKSSTKESSLPMTTATSVEFEYSPSIPLISENGQPVFVIIEFELHRSLQPARTLEDLTDCINEMVHTYILPPDPYTPDLAEEQYSNCIRKLVDTLSEAYQNFSEQHSVADRSTQKTNGPSTSTEIFGSDNASSRSNSSCNETRKSNIDTSCRYNYIKDEIACFLQYLHETGSYLSVRSTLKNKIIMLLDQKFKIETHTTNKKEYQNFVAKTYVYLVEQMHCTLNKIVQGQSANELSDCTSVMTSSLFAEESCALGHNDDARKEYLNMISNDQKNADVWIEYAIYLIRMQDLDRATECCREAIAMNKQHKIALLLYGLLLSKKEQYREGEIFLQSLTQIYPRFAEGWAILHLFYLRTEFFPGADTAIEVAKKCLKDKDPDTSTMPFLDRDPLSWTALNCPKDRIYLITAVLLMKMCCFDFAGIALAQELSEMGRTRHLLYYLAVQHYIEHRYEDAICHLNEAVDLHGMEYSVATLMGHCYLDDGNFVEATYCYEFANSSFDRPEDLHLAQLKLGYLYIETNRFEDAKKLLLVVCKNSPTYRSWLGVGVACYHLGDMKNAETSLTEANNLNMHNAEIWGYLCLVNMSLQHYDEFLQCYRQVVKNNLENIRVWTLIKDLMKALGYTTPVVLINSQESIMHESVENEDDCDHQSFYN